MLWLLLHEKESSSYTYLFRCTEMSWLFISSSTMSVTSSDTGSVASRAKDKLTRSKCNWTRIWSIYNVDETTHYLHEIFTFSDWDRDWDRFLSCWCQKRMQKNASKMWHQAKERQQMELECVPHENCIFSIQAVFASVLAMFLTLWSYTYTGRR